MKQFAITESKLDNVTSDNMILIEKGARARFQQLGKRRTKSAGVDPRLLQSLFFTRCCSQMGMRPGRGDLLISSIPVSLIFYARRSKHQCLVKKMANG